jgi:hypothetical protein
VFPVTSVKERMRKLRERRQAEGMVRVEVVLPRELVDRCRLPGETINACLQRVLLQSVSGDRPQPAPVSGDTVATTPLPHVSGNNVSGNKKTGKSRQPQSVSGDSNRQVPGPVGKPTLQNIPVSGDSRETIITWLIVAKDAMRLSYQKIADTLNTQGVPTFSGKGLWQKGNVERFYKGKTD